MLLSTEGSAVTLYLLAAAEPQPDIALGLFVIAFFTYLAWLLFTAGGNRD